MRILYYDCFSGISGDMNLGAMLDLGMDADYLRTELSKLHMNEEFDLKIKKDVKNGITGTKADVLLKIDSQDHLHDGHVRDKQDGHSHSHHLEHEHSSHFHSHGDKEHAHTVDVHPHAEPDTGHIHKHDRHFADIKKLIESSDLNDNVKKLSIAMFLKIAQAEAKVHGVTIEEVHFHEVGAVDSIVDIVGAAVALDYWKADKVMASSVQVGGGFVKCEHGLMPVPAPATAEILKGIPIKSGLVNFETTTPTGAAILASNVEQYSDSMNYSVTKVGYGLGTKTFNIPNVLRVYLLETEEVLPAETQYMLEVNIDDMNPEMYGYIEEKLFEAGALDVYKTPIIMKKGRPAIKLSVLINSAIEPAILVILFTETTSIGLRKYPVEKIMLQRDFYTLNTKYGDVSIKRSFYNGKAVQQKAEYQECAKLAKENKVPISQIYNEINKLVN